jgi:hypothetical protein
MDALGVAHPPGGDPVGRLPVALGQRHLWPSLAGVMVARRDPGVGGLCGSRARGGSGQSERGATENCRRGSTAASAALTKSSSMRSVLLCGIIRPNGYWVLAFKPSNVKRAMGFLSAETLMESTLYPASMRPALTPVRSRSSRVRLQIAWICRSAQTLCR